MNQSPRVLGNRYEVGDLLGRGGMAEVHLGRDTRLGRVVAIKLLRTDLARDPVFQARFRREAQSAAGLNHPAIVSVYDTGEEELTESGGGVVALPYIVMEYVEGRTLRDVLREGPMEVHHALEVTAGVLSALDYSHRMGIVHRDIKPANVMLTASGDVKVMDFGIARALADVSATMTQTQAVIGTAQYLSPEQARGETVDARSDLYSAGCLLFELMTGRPPFVADSPVAVAYQHVRETPPAPSVFNPRIPEVVDRVVLHALAKDREARYQTANDFRADLEAAMAGRSIAATTGAVPAPAAAAGAQATTEYLPSRTGAPAGHGGAAAVPSYPGPTAAYPQPAGGYDPHQQYAPQAYGQQPYAPTSAGQVDQSRRGGRRAAAATTNRRWGFLLLALVVIAVFAAAAYGVSSLVSQNSLANSLVLVPSVTKDPQSAALSTLKAEGFTVSVQQEPSDSVDAGLATRVTPTGSQVKGTAVVLFVSTGSSAVTVPDVQGQTTAQARTALVNAGLKVSAISNVESRTGQPKDTVVSTEPAAGQSVARGQEVTLNVSDGKLVVPNEVGQDSKAATADLQSKGFTDLQITEVPVDSMPGQVLDQDPAAGVTLTVQKKITLIVAVAVAPTGQTHQNNGNGNGQGNGNGNGQGQNNG